MKDYKVFDIIGPVMIGPSSSHTAGACRIAKTARIISQPNFTEVEFQLHGSFASTYKGHGTDKALLAGALGFETDDVRIRDSFRLAEMQGIKYKFTRQDLGKVHPNSVRIIFYYPDGSQTSVTGSSIGGGNIEIVELDGISVSYTGVFPTIIVKYIDTKGIIRDITNVLSVNDYNIESIKTVKRDDEVTLIAETSEEISAEVIKELFSDKRFIFKKYLKGV